MNNPRIGFIGAGVMGGAIIKGLISSDFIQKENIIASEVTQELAQKAFDALGIKVVTDNKELIKNSDVIVLATKPYIIKKLLVSLKDFFSEDKLVISIAAGVSTETIEETLEQQIPVIRTMPNTPALIGEGMTAVCRGKYVKDEQIKFAAELFSKVGRYVEVPENLINAVTGISGSGPAFVYLMIEALADGGLKLGLPKKTAIELAAQTFIGAAKLVLETGKHPSVLKDEVTTPGGTTIAGLATMESEGVRSALIKTVGETARVAKELGN